ncbi:MAG: choice-of-anchor D domain-containing protein, partial [Bacteroidales bacterium]|nr:choice-of-anchor D domain-containing protein [Bacteroidales bacterium]
IIPAGENIDIPVRFDATGLYGGDYNAEIIISSNDPITPEEIVPAHLSVTGAPRISIFGQFDSTSEQGYYSTGASTEHIFNTSNIADSDGTLKVTIEGDFNSSSEYAIVFIETIFLDSINPTTTGQTIRSYTIPKDELNGYILDGIVEVRIENSIAVDYGYADIHTVRLTYTYNNDSIDFGQQYISYTSNREITIENTGTDTLIVSSIESNLPEFVPDLDQITIGPEDFYALNIAFTPEAAIVYNGILTIRSNDPVDSVLYIDITGEGILPPVISVTPDSMDVALFTGDTLTQYLTIDNTNGGSDLVYSISTTSTMNIEKRVINNPSGYMSDFNKPNPYEIPVEYSNSKPIKLKPDNIILSSAGRLFGFNYESDLIVELDMSDGTVINSMYQPVETDWGELAFDGELLYFSTNNFVTVINSTLTMILDSFTLNVPVTIDGLGHTGEYLVGVSYENNEIYLFDDETGEVINTIIPGVSIGGGLTFGGDRNTVFTGFGPIYEIDIETGIVLNSFSSVGTVYSLAYSNANGILISNNESSGTIDFYNPDDGTHLYSFDAYGIRGLAADEAANGINNWLSLNVYEGVVAAGSSQNINVLFDATGLYGGLYEANITINSNDPVTPEVIVPVHLSVTGAPDIYISDEYNPCIFGEQYVGYTSMLEILIENIGTDTLNISSIESDLPEFIPNISQLTLAPEEDYTIDISFTPAAEIFYSGQLTILSDDPNESILNILLEGQGVLPPIMTVLPESMDVVLFSEDSLVEYLIIDNTEGGSDLVFEINTSYIAAGNLMKNTDKNIYGLNNNGIETDSYFKDKYPLAVGDFISKSPSPLPLTCLSVDPNTGLIYAQENYGYNFYKYSPYEDTWTSLTLCPISSGNNGGATCLEGKIYTSYTGNDQIGVYDILSDSWSTLISQVYGAGNITTDGQNIYLVNGYEF